MDLLILEIDNYKNQYNNGQQVDRGHLTEEEEELECGLNLCLHCSHGQYNPDRRLSVPLHALNRASNWRIFVSLKWLITPARPSADVGERSGVGVPMTERRLLAIRCGFSWMCCARL